MVAELIIHVAILAFLELRGQVLQEREDPGARVLGVNAQVRVGFFQEFLPKRTQVLDHVVHFTFVVAHPEIVSLELVRPGGEHIEFGRPRFGALVAREKDLIKIAVKLVTGGGIENKKVGVVGLVAQDQGPHFLPGHRTRLVQQNVSQRVHLCSRVPRRVVFFFFFFFVVVTLRRNAPNQERVTLLFLEDGLEAVHKRSERRRLGFFGWRRINAVCRTLVVDGFRTLAGSGHGGDGELVSMNNGKDSKNRSPVVGRLIVGWQQ